jgi:hypothetical protein
MRAKSKSKGKGNNKDAASSHQGAPRCPLKTVEEMEELVHEQSYCHVMPCPWCGRIDKRGQYVDMPIEQADDVLYGLCVNCLTRYRAGMPLPKLRLKQLRGVLLDGKMYVAMHAVIDIRGSVIAEFLSSPMKFPLVVAQHPHSFWVHDVRQQPKSKGKGKGEDYIWIGKGKGKVFGKGE